MKKILALIFILAIFYGLNQYDDARSRPVNTEPNRPVPAQPAESKIANAFQQQISGIDVEGFGEVIKTLPDDQSGSRHQKFLLKLTAKQTLLISHNIDIAQRIDNLQRGDIVHFKGVYEWNAQGGVVHWTHRDPQNRHTGGWLELNGRRYQ